MLSNTVRQFIPSFDILIFINTTRCFEHTHERNGSQDWKLYDAVEMPALSLYPVLDTSGRLSCYQSGPTKKKHRRVHIHSPVLFYALPYCMHDPRRSQNNMHEIEWQMIGIRTLIYILRSEHVECGCNCSCFRHYSSELSRICKVKPVSNIIYGKKEHSHSNPIQN